MATTAGIRWSSSPGDMAQRVEAYGKRLLEAVYQLASEWARRLADEAKATHPWTNRTGEAEAKLFGRAVRLATGALIILGHGAAHGIFLERRWAGRWAVILPTLQRNYASIMQSAQGLVR